MVTRELRPVDRQEFLETIGPIQVRLGKLEVALAARSESEDTQPKATPSQDDVDALVKAAKGATETMNSDGRICRDKAAKALRAALAPFQKG